MNVSPFGSSATARHTGRPPWEEGLSTTGRSHIATQGHIARSSPRVAQDNSTRRTRVGRQTSPAITRPPDCWGCRSAPAQASSGQLRPAQASRAAALCMTVTRAAAFPVQAASLREGALHDTAARQHAQRWRAHVSYGCALRRAARCPPRLMGGLGSAPRRVGAPRAITGMAMFAASIAYGCSLYSASIAYGYRLNAWQTDWNKYFVRLPGCTRLGIDE